ncbi:hypothetical protein NRB_42140 [Novosphingobium sp. 11B]
MRSAGRQEYHIGMNGPRFARKQPFQIFARALVSQIHHAALRENRLPQSPPQRRPDHAHAKSARDERSPAKPSADDRKQQPDKRRDRDVVPNELPASQHDLRSESPARETEHRPSGHEFAASSDHLTLDFCGKRRPAPHDPAAPPRQGEVLQQQLQIAQIVEIAADEHLSPHAPARGATDRIEG